MPERMLEAFQVVGPDGSTYLIPVKAKDDWYTWLELAGDKWSPPNYAKSVEAIATCHT